MNDFIGRRATLLLDQGRIAVEKGDYVTALHEFRAAAYVRRTSDALTNWGSMEHCLGDTSRAIELCHEAIAVDPEWGGPYNNIGSYLVAMQRFDEAIPWFERAIDCHRFEGFRQIPHINLGKIFEARGQLMEALHHFEEALRLDPCNHEVMEAAQALRHRLR